MKIHSTIQGNVLLASDFHFGIVGKDSSRARELHFKALIEEKKEALDAVFLVGDIFDYWFEYASVIPKGHSHFWSVMRSLRDHDIPVYFFTGNHDMWLFDYCQEEYGIEVLTDPTLFNINGKTCLLHHGDGIGPSDYGYKFIKKLFSNKFAQWCYARLHPNFAIWLMRFSSGTSRSFGNETLVFKENEEWQVIYAEEVLEETKVDFFFFGHRHIPAEFTLSNSVSTYFNLGDWLHNYSYVYFPVSGPKLLYYES